MESLTAHIILLVSTVLICTFLFVKWHFEDKKEKKIKELKEKNKKEKRC